MSAVFLKLLNMSMAAGWLVAAVIVLRFCLKKAPKAIHCALWALVAVRLLCPVSPESEFSLIPENVANGTVVSEWADGYVGDAAYDAVIGREPIPAGGGGYDAVTQYDSLGKPAATKNTVVPVLSWVWLAGMLSLLLYAAISYLCIRARVRVSLNWKDNIWLHERVDSPFILGIIRPRIYLPFGMDEGQMNHVVAHEQAHLRRRDHWWKPLGFVLLAVYWFHPLMWVAYVLLCRDIELACDEKVIRDMSGAEKKAYSEALLACSLPRRRITACPLAFGEVGVKKRIASVLHYKKPAFWILVAALAASVVVAVCFLTNPKDSGEKISPAETIWSQRDTCYPGELLAMLCPMDLWEDAIGEIPSVSIPGNFGPHALFLAAPEDAEALDIAMARRAALLMRLYPDEVFYVMWDYPDAEGNQVRREFHADELEVILALSSDSRTYEIPAMAEDVERLIRFLSIDENLFLQYAAEGNDCSPLLEQQENAIWFTPEDIHDIEYMELVWHDGQRFAPITGEAYDYVQTRFGSAQEIGATGCPYHSVLYLHRADGVVGKMLPAEDSCDIFQSDGKYYQFGDRENPPYSDSNEAFYNHFGTSVSDLPHYSSAPESSEPNTFSDIMGYNGYIVTEESGPHNLRSYYAVEGDQQWLIAETFGFGEAEDYVVDLDGDGITELVANVTYGGDGARRAYVYRRTEAGIELGDFSTEDLPNFYDWGVNSTWSEYDPATGIFHLYYAQKHSEEYAVLETTDLERFRFEPFHPA